MRNLPKALFLAAKQASAHAGSAKQGGVATASVAVKGSGSSSIQDSAGGICSHHTATTCVVCFHIAIIVRQAIQHYVSCSLILLILAGVRTIKSESAFMTCSSVPTAVLTPHKHGSIDWLCTLSWDMYA